MKFFFSDHFLLQVKERRISKKLAKLVYLQAEKKYFDTLTKHRIAIVQTKHLGKTRSIMVAFDAIIEDEIWFVTVYPLSNEEIEKRVKQGRWIIENEKN